MTDTFDDLKIAPELVAGAESLGWDAPAGLQRDAMAVVRRGNNVVLHASAGSGVVGAYGLAVLDRLLQPETEAGDPGALVLVPDARAATATAGSLARLAAPAGLTVRALAPGWADRPADLLVAPVDAALAAVQGSALKLDGVVTLVVDGADLIADAGQWAALEPVVDAVPGAAQRVVVTGRFDDAISSFLEGHVRRAMTVPGRTDPEAPDADAATVRYAVTPEADKAAATAHFLTTLTDDQVAVVCRTVDRAEAVEELLTARGVAGAAEGTPEVLVLLRSEADQRSVQAGVLSYDVPFDADQLASLHSGGGVVLVTPRERAHLLRIARRAGLRLQAVAVPAPASTAVDDMRQRLRQLAREDLTPELALLEPLLDQIPAPELAAAAIRLARAGTGETATPPGRPTGTGSGTAPPPPGTWVHLFVTIGERDGVGPGDLVGAITGEAGVGGDRIGKIDIRESHSTVEVATEVAGKVIEALNGRSLKGRSLRVDYDRKDRGGSKPAGKGRKRS